MQIWTEVGSHLQEAKLNAMRLNHPGLAIPGQGVRLMSCSSKSFVLVATSQTLFISSYQMKRLCLQTSFLITWSTSPKSNLQWDSVCPILSLVKQFFHFSVIHPTFNHPNVIRIFMGCSVLDILYQLDLSLLEVLFVYTIKISLKKRISLSAHIHSLKFVTRLSDFSKGWPKDMY